MQESYREGVANYYSGPEPCEGGGNAAVEALDRGICRLGMELRNRVFPGADTVGRCGRQDGGGVPTGAEGRLTAEASNSIGVLFYGEKGWMALDANGTPLYDEDPATPTPTQQAKYEEPRKTDTGPHITNFLKAVRSRNYQDVYADVESASSQPISAIWRTSATGWEVRCSISISPRNASIIQRRTIWRTRYLGTSPKSSS